MEKQTAIAAPIKDTLNIWLAVMLAFSAVSLFFFLLGLSFAFGPAATIAVSLLGAAGTVAATSKLMRRRRIELVEPRSLPSSLLPVVSLVFVFAVGPWFEWLPVFWLFAMCVLACSFVVFFSCSLNMTRKLYIGMLHGALIVPNLAFMSFAAMVDNGLAYPFGFSWSPPSSSVQSADGGFEAKVRHFATWGFATRSEIIVSPAKTVDLLFARIGRRGETVFTSERWMDPPVLNLSFDSDNALQATGRAGVRGNVLMFELTNYGWQPAD